MTFATTHTLDQLEGLPLETVVRVAGCRGWLRRMGNMTFAEITSSGGAVMLMLQKKVLGEDDYLSFVKGVREGDLVGVEGSLFRTLKEELAIKVQSWEPILGGSAPK